MSRKRERNRNNRGQGLPAQTPSPPREVQAYFASYTGPLPPPEVLQKYAQVFPGCAERIVAMAERQSEHRKDLERRVIESNCKSQERGQILGAVLAGIVLVGGFFLIASDKSTTGISLIVGDAITIIGAFVYSRRRQARERIEKDRAFTEAAPNFGQHAPR